MDRVTSRLDNLAKIKKEMKILFLFGKTELENAEVLVVEMKRWLMWAYSVKKNIWWFFNSVRVYIHSFMHSFIRTIKKHFINFWTKAENLFHF